MGQWVMGHGSHPLTHDEITAQLLKVISLAVNYIHVIVLSSVS